MKRRSRDERRGLNPSDHIDWKSGGSCGAQALIYMRQASLTRETKDLTAAIGREQKAFQLALSRPALTVLADWRASGADKQKLHFIVVVINCGTEPANIKSIELMVDGRILLTPRPEDYAEVAQAIALRDLMSEWPNRRISDRIKSETGAILIVVEAERLQATECGISTPQRIIGQLWPGEVLGQKPRTLLSIGRSIYFRWKYRAGREARVDWSGWKVGPVGSGAVKKLLLGCGGRPRR